MEWNSSGHLREIPGSSLNLKKNEIKKVVLAVAAQAPLSGTGVSESAVDCGTTEQGKKESTNLLCLPAPKKL